MWSCLRDEEVVETPEQTKSEDRPPVVRRWSHWLPTIFLVLALVAAVSGTVYWLQDRQSSGGVEIFLPTATAEPPSVVHVTGAVVSPGVYTLMPGSRVGDAIDAAGGTLPNGDVESLNLAAVVLDGDRIEVSVSTGGGEVTPLPVETSSGSENAGQMSGVIDLNTADQVMLETLPNIGPSRAKAILDWREANGPFASLDSLRDVPGIGPETVSGMRGLVVPE